MIYLRLCIPIRKVKQLSSNQTTMLLVVTFITVPLCAHPSDSQQEIASFTTNESHDSICYVLLNPSLKDHAGASKIGQIAE